MFQGFLTLGTFELVNNSRTHAYAENAGICWLKNCDECETLHTALADMGFVPPTYVSPKDDPAPWHVSGNPDSDSFFGLFGLSIEGAENSTRKSTMTARLMGGAQISPSYYAQREMIVTVLAVAADEAGMQYGLNWARDMPGSQPGTCEGDDLFFFDNCPCTCPHSAGEAQLCREECVEPYARYFHSVRVTEGPTVLARHPVHDGALATLEFILVAGDPKEYGLYESGGAFLVNGGTRWVDPPRRSPTPDPWFPSSPMPLPSNRRVPHDGEWLRRTFPLDMSGVRWGDLAPVVEVEAAGGSTGKVRLSVQQDGEEEPTAVWVVPRIPEGGRISMDMGAGEVVTSGPGGSSRRRALVTNDNGGAPFLRPVRRGRYNLIVDRELDVPVHVNVQVSGVGAA